MANRSQPLPRKSWLSQPWLSLDGWAVLAATLFIALILVGVLPRIPW